jgi:hypothetical protein
MNKMLTGPALILALMATSGCQSFPFNFGLRDPAPAAQPDMSSYFAQRIEDGRRHLAANRPAAAINAFRQASYHPDQAGAAYNGMAIAYDRMGRHDLAERFFAQALQADPDDARFARNAARFEATMLARRGADEAVELAAAPSPASDDAPAEVAFVQAAAALDAQAAPAPEGRMQRVSAQEVRIASRDDWTTRVASHDSARPAVLHIGPRPDDAPVLADAAPEYPVRIALASVPVVRGEIVAGNFVPHAASRFADAQGSVRVRVSGALRSPDRPAYPVTVRLNPPR